MAELEITEAFNYDRFEKFEPENLTCKCLVHFRPKKDWKGIGYGFDWIRLQDYMPQIYTDPAWDPANKADTPFEKIVSKQYMTGTNNLEKDINEKDGEFRIDKDLFNKLKNIYGYHKILWKEKEKNEDGTIIHEDYYCSWMTIYPSKTVKLSLIIDVEEIPEKIVFDYDKECFAITPEEIAGSSLKKGVNLLTDKISVTCKNEFRGGDRDEKVINAFVKMKDDTDLYLSGQLFIWDNYKSKRKTVKAVLVNVQLTNPQNIPAKLPNGLPNMEEVKIATQTPVEEVMNQAYISLGTDFEISMPLWDDPQFKKGGNYMDLQGYIIGYYYNTVSPPGRIDILDYLNACLKKHLKQTDPTADENLYDKYIKAFVFQETGGRYKSGSFGFIGGYSNGSSNDIVIYDGRSPSVIAHELLHSLNLAHTFTNKEASSKALFTFKSKMTNNIMDYSDFSKHTMWIWQMRIANDCLDSNGYVK